MATSPLDYILQGARKILDKGQEAFRDDSSALGIAKNTFAPSSLLSATNKLFFEQSTAPQQYLKKVTGLKSPAETQRELLATTRANQLPTQRLDQFGLPASTIGKQTTKVTDILKTATPKEKELLALSQARNLTAGFAGYAPQEKALTSIAPQVAKSTDIGKIANLLKKEIPSLADDTANNFARVFKDLTDPKAIDTAINKIKFQAQGKTTGMADDLITNVKAIMETGKPLPRTPVLPSKLPPVASKVGSEANPLMQEAPRVIDGVKYNSFYEFVKAQGTPLYSGGLDLVNEFKQPGNFGTIYQGKNHLGGGIYVTESPKYAKYYGEKITESIIPKNIKVFDLTKELDSKTIRSVVKSFQNEYAKTIKSGFTKDITPELLKATDAEELLGILQNEIGANSTIVLKKAGFDAIKAEEIATAAMTGVNPDAQGTVYNIFDPKNIKTKSQLEVIWNKAQGTKATPHDLDAVQALREAKGLGPQDIMAKYPDLNLKRDIPVTDVYGNKAVIPEGEALTPYELKGNKVLLQDGETYIVSKNQFQNIKGNALSGEAKPFAPELEGLEETVKGASYDPEVYNKYVRELKEKYDPSGRLNMSMLYDELPKTEQVKFNQMKKAQDTVRDTSTKYSSYTLPNGENYREVLIKAPKELSTTELPQGFTIEKLDDGYVVVNRGGAIVKNAEPTAELAKTNYIKWIDSTKPETGFKSSHWDEPNVISHLRLNDRTYNGKKVTFMEELQSDWAREGRDKGFSKNLPKGTENDIEIKFVKSNVPEGHDPKNYPGYYEAFDKRTSDFLGRGGTKPDLMERALEEINLTKGVPYNPLLKNWQELSIKRALKDAVDNNAEYFAWINGEQTSARYNLATHVENVNWGKGDMGAGKNITIKAKEGKTIQLAIDKSGIIETRAGTYNVPSDWKGKKLDEVLGKGLADKIMEKESGTLSGEGLKFGGEWANNLYDKQVKSIVEDLTGGKVEVIDLKLPIDKEKETLRIGTDAFNPLKKSDIKVGQEFNKGIKDSQYIITDILGDGKFKAVPKNIYERADEIVKTKMRGNSDPDYLFTHENVPNFVSSQETFDISQKTTTQQAIRLTPEIKARIRGEAPALKKPSGIDILKTIANNYRKNPKLGLSSDDVTKGLKPDSFDKAKKIRQMKTSAEIPSLERTAEMQGVTPAVKLKAPQKQTVKLPQPNQVVSPKTLKPELPRLSTGEERTLEKLAQQQASKANLVSGVEVSSLPKIIQQQTPVSKKVGLLDYIRTPENVLKKIGLEKESKLIRDSYEAYTKELPTNIQKITDWSKRVSPESNKRIFRYLDNQAVDLNPTELKVAGEIKVWLAEWADRLGLPKDNRIAEYITHIFDDQLIKKEFDEDLAKIIADKIPGSVYNPFLEKRLGAKGYIEDTWRALDAYVKRATRKVHMDKALNRLEEVSSSLEESQWKYIKRYADRINMRPTEVDNLIDNQLKQVIGYRLGQRPVANISRVLRQTTFRGMLGANLGSALRNLTQGVNTYAKLGEKYTAIGYKDVLTKGLKELKAEGILDNSIIQDRTLSATKKALEKLDKGLFFFFDTAEKINRGSAYYGAKAKALSLGKTEAQAIDYAKKIVRDTQFLYGAIDTPVAMNSDIVKVMTQFMTYPIKQMEFLAGMAKNKEYMGVARYVLGGMAIVYTIGQALGLKPTELIPFYDYVSGQSKFGVPPSLKFPAELLKAGLGTKDKFGQERSLGKKLKDVAIAGAGVIPGGIQAKKTLEGSKMVAEGGSFDKSGKLQFEQGQSPASKLQSVLLGKYAGKGAREFFDKGMKARAVIKTEKELAQEVLAKLKSGEFGSEAVAEEYLNSELKKIEKAKKEERFALPPKEYAQELLNLLKAGKLDEVTAEKELNSYLNQPEIADRTTKAVQERGKVGLVLDYGKAFTIDPGNAWKALTTAEKLGVVEGNLVEMQRFQLKKYNEAGGSDEYKKKAMAQMGLPWSEAKNYKLEHVVPVKAGGDTSANNLLIVTNAEHNSYTRFDNAAAKAVQNKKTTRRKVTEIAIKLKIDKTITINEALNML